VNGTANRVECATHGLRAAAFVCVHSMETLSDGHPRGLLWSRDSDGCLNGYCDACERYLERNGGEWNDETEAHADIKLVCEGCFRRIAALNGIEELD